MQFIQTSFATSMKRLVTQMPRLVVTLGVLAVVPLLGGMSGCAKGDVGAPCNHGRIDPPDSKLVTFPALSCDQLLCVYADEQETPSTPCSVGPQGDAVCNMLDPAKSRFECVASKSDPTVASCKLKNTYVLQRSMCSKKCSGDADCQNGGITKQVVADETSCKGGFKCVRIQTLGEFCCEKLCVCEDDISIPVVEDIQLACSMNMQEGCCDQMPVPEACGKQ